MLLSFTGFDKGTNCIENDEDDSLCKYGTQLPQYEQVKSIKFNFKKFWQKNIFYRQNSIKKAFLSWGYGS